MAHNPWHLEGRLIARYHVQIELLQKPTVAVTPAKLEVLAKVMRIFRGDDNLHVGSNVRFAVAVRDIHDDTPHSEPWMLFTKFKIARYMEVFLGGTPPQCEACCGQIAAILTLTNMPSLRVPLREELDGLPLIGPKSELEISNVV